MAPTSTHPARTASERLADARTEQNSFTLHAPLELLARVDLLDEVAPEHRDRAVGRIRGVGEMFAASGDPVPPPDDRRFDGVPDAWAGLDAALSAGDPDLGDAAACHLIARLDPATICARLAATTTRKLTAAAHAPILLANWPRVAERFEIDPRFVRHLVRSLRGTVADAELPSPHRERRPGSLADLDSVICGVEPLGSPGWGIAALVGQAESARLLDDAPSVDDAEIDDAFRVVLRAAARAMVLDDPDEAPYGWSHALTIPLALWQANRVHGDPREALDMALTHAVGFRAAGGAIGLPSSYRPGDTGLDLADALTAEPAVAAATAFHHGATAAGATVLRSAASIGFDAHLVKYAHACRDAAALDPSHERLYAAATASLISWWHHHPEHGVGA